MKTENDQEFRELKQKEVDQNFEAFQKILPHILEEHYGQFALMKDQKIINFFSTFMDAEKAGHLFDSTGLFSVQEVTDSIINLGAFSCYAEV